MFTLPLAQAPEAERINSGSPHLLTAELGNGEVFFPADGGNYYLYDLSGRVLNQFEGTFRAFTPDGERVVMYDESEDLSRLYQLKGLESVAFEGDFVQFIPPEQLVTASSNNRFHLYNWQGDRLATITGNYFQGISPDGQWLVVSDDWETRFLQLHDYHQRSFRGRFEGFTPDAQGFILDDLESGKSTLYDLSGQVQSSFEGHFQTFTEDGQGIATYSYDSSTSVTGAQSRLYRLDGTLQATMPGYFEATTLDGHKLLTDDYEQSWLYDLLQQEAIAVTGGSPKILPNQQGFITYSPSRDRSWLSDFEGHPLANFEGYFAEVLPNGLLGLVSSRQDHTWLYRLDGSPPRALLVADFAGKFVNLTPDGQGLLTGFFFDDFPFLTYGDYRLFRLDGSQLTSFSETFLTYTPEGQALIVYSPSQTFLISLEGERQPFCPGIPLGLTPQGDGLATYVSETEQSYLCTFEGEEQISLPGIVQGMTPDGQRLMLLQPIPSNNGGQI